MNAYKQMREKRKMSQSDVAVKLKLKSSQFVSNWERNLCRPPPKLFHKISIIYNVSLQYLVDLELEAHEKVIRKKMGKP